MSACEHEGRYVCRFCGDHLPDHDEWADLDATEDLRARVAQLEARNAELEQGLKDMRDLIPSNGPEEHWAIQRACRRAPVLEAKLLYHDGSKALAAVRLAQETLGRYHEWAEGDAEPALAALAEVFREGK